MDIFFILVATLPIWGTALIMLNVYAFPKCWICGKRSWHQNMRESGGFAAWALSKPYFYHQSCLEKTGYSSFVELEMANWIKCNEKREKRKAEREARWNAKHAQ